MKNKNKKRTFTHYRLILLLSLFYILTACGGGSPTSASKDGSDDSSLDTTAPTVNSTSPENTAMDVATAISLKVTFGEKMSINTIDVTSFTFAKSGGDDIDGDVSFDDESNVAVFIPTNPLENDSTYIATLSNSISDVSGNNLLSYSWSFSTVRAIAAETDNTSPTVVSVLPDNSAINVSVDSKLIVTFDESMMVNTINAMSFTLSESESGGDAIGGGVSFDEVKNIATFTPSNPLANDQAYTVSLGSGITDEDGNALSAYSWSFITEAGVVVEADTTAPMVSITSPVDSAIDVARESALTAMFNEKMLASSINDTSFILEKADGSRVAGVVSYDINNNVVTFMPNDFLVKGTTYTATLNSSISDENGNTLVEYRWDFSTVMDNTSPKVTSMSPEDTTIDVKRNIAITATFDEDIFSSTVDAASFTLIKSNLGKSLVSANVSFDGKNNVANLIPKSPLGMLEKYTATLSTAITDLSGNPLDVEYSWSFTTANGAWLTPELIENENMLGVAIPKITFDNDGNALAIWSQFDGYRDNIWSNYFDGKSWGTAELIENDNVEYAKSPQISFDKNGNALAIWEQWDRIKFRMWSNRFDGTSWGVAEPFETSNAESTQLLRSQLTVNSSGDALAVWYKNDGAANKVSLWSNYFDGVNWGVPKRIDTTAGSPTNFNIIFGNDGNAIAMWQQYDGTNYNILMSYYDGTEWGLADAIEIGNAGTAVKGLQLGVDSNENIFAAWYQYDGSRTNIWVNRFNGVTLGTAELIETGNGYAEGPQIAFDNKGNALVTWYQFDGARTNIWANRFNGKSWGTAALIETNDAGYALYPQIAVDPNGSAIVVWQQSEKGRTDIWANRFDGLSWGDAQLLENETVQGAVSPQIAIDNNGSALALWQQWDGARNNLWASRFE